MERRLIYAIALMIVVAVLPSLFLKPAPRRPAPPAAPAPESTARGVQPPAVAPVPAEALRPPAA
ncbi:MAG: hypothetical protein ACM37V_09375, partial [Gemmatimonadota bacterium]